MPSSTVFIPSWEDLRFPASAINPTGQAAPPSLNVDNGLWEFSATVVNTIAFQVQMPHSWKAGTPLLPHVHWRKKTQGTGTVVWELKYEFANLGVTYTDTYTNTTLTAHTVSEHTSPEVGDALVHLITPLGSIDMTNKGISTMGVCIMSRLGNDGTNDTYAGLAQLLSVDFHYQVDSLGSQQEYIKGTASYG